MNMDSIEKQVRSHRHATRLPGQIARRIEGKYARHAKVYGRHLDATARALESSPALYDQRSSIPGLGIFFRSHVSIALEHAAQANVLWCKATDAWLTASRHPGRLLLRNPVSGNDESWSRPSSASKASYTVHHKNGGRNGKSRFLGNYDFIKSREIAVFEGGVGLLDTACKMRLYAKFTRPIGRSVVGAPLDYLCLEIERVPRSKRKLIGGKTRKSGWLLRMHGYPVGPADLMLDFRGTPLKAAGLPTLTGPA